MDLTKALQFGNQAALIVIDLQKNGLQSDESRGIPLMDGFSEVVDRSAVVIAAARSAGIPVIFTMENHRPDLLDIGREMDGSEGVHCLENDPMTEIIDQLGRLPGDMVVRKRRYSVFFGTDLEILLRGIGAKTLFLLGALTDVCVHYSYVDAHQNNYTTYVIEDCVIGSSVGAHTAALEAMEYLQRGARVQSREVIDKVLAALVTE